MVRCPFGGVAWVPPRQGQKNNSMRCNHGRRCSSKSGATWNSGLNDGLLPHAQRLVP